MDTKELKSLQEAWNQVQGIDSPAYNNSYRNNEGIKVSLSEESVNLCVEKAMEKVFYGGLDEMTTKETKEGLKYKVRVKDAKTNSSYIRFATREKIAALRANPAIASVELTDHDPSEANRQGVTNVRQTFSAGPNSNRSSYQSLIARKAENQRRKDNKAMSLGKSINTTVG